jgi:phosphatidylglycerophosphatase A
MNTTTDSDLPASTGQRRAPLAARLVASAGYLGYLPPAPGTWGSAAGCLIYFLLVVHGGPWGAVVLHGRHGTYPLPLIALAAIVGVWISGFGLWAADEVSRATGVADPQYVVIDEVSGQLLTYTLAFAPANWKYLLAGFILFRVFDIWKPFPARQAESLPGGWGIMADDWVAGIYAALGLWIARMLGL